MSETKTIWKFVLPEIGTWWRINMPKLSRVCCVDQQDGNVTFWAEVFPQNPLEERMFSAFGTGWDIPKTSIYHGTVQIGQFVWHLYEQQPPPDGMKG
jgi:hypothetical protein